MTETIKCLIYVGDTNIEDMDDEKEQQKALQEHISALYRDGSLLYNDYLAPQSLSFEEAPVFGTSAPEKIIDWAENMEQRVCSNAWATIQENFPVLDTHDFKSIKEKSAKLADAFGILAGNLNSNSNELFLSSYGQFCSWADDFHMAAIRKAPEKWAICWIEFSAVDM